MMCVQWYQTLNKTLPLYVNYHTDDDFVTNVYDQSNFNHLVKKLFYGKNNGLYFYHLIVHEVLRCNNIALEFRDTVYIVFR